VSKFRFLKSRDDYHRHFSAVDVGTELIKVLVVRREGLDGVVLGVGREPQHPEAMEAGAIASPDHVIDACNRALEASEDMAGVVPGQAVVGIAGELVKGFSSAVSYPRERPDQRVRESELKNMLQMVERRALREAQHLLEMERSYGQMEPRLVQSAITQVRMDGYPVANPVGYQGTNLEVTVFNTFAPITQVGAVETIARDLDLELAGMVAQPYALARACASDEAWQSGGVIVDIGGGTTDVALLRAGGVEGIRMFNLGGRAFTRRLSRELGISMEEAEARKIRHSEGLLPPDQEQQVSSLLAGDVDVLLQGLNLCLQDLARGEVLPPNVYVCGGGSLLRDLVDQLMRSPWWHGLPFPREPSVRRLGPHDVRGLSDATGLLHSAQDVGPMALANHNLQAETEEGDALNAVMQGVLKGMKV
jgi:cell division protein FtsA